MAEFFDTGLGGFLILFAQVLAVVAFVMVSLLFLVYGDRKIWAAVQMRRGPNVVGAFGLLQSVADALKYVVKEVVVPAGADRAVFLLAPLIAFTLSIIAWAVIPFSDGWVVSDINVGILYIFAISSLEVYGVIMGGWASNSKYPFLGSLRSAAQMISYEVAIGFIIMGVLISAGSLNLSPSSPAQDTGWGAARLVLAAASADGGAVLRLGTGRDEPPALRPAGGGIGTRGGLQVEYSSTPYLLFMAGEYIAIFLMCALMT
jgi:NADH-quinone oxidoreductase subunit H